LFLWSGIGQVTGYDETAISWPATA